ncbi:hypothetical protein QFZ22_000108 [Streptomyces canus]|uniref:Uncharacterized protein n=1 Tax=Streptomyces canus TaxID=58343 RepID=A0AAW8F2V5_9ACTN|nr:hypothetical protein [Streptomyces canus]MDQ0904123.1 hypothetical protein [Streptomyces canus]
MGLFTPKYPTSDTPGVSTPASAGRSGRRGTSTSDSGASPALSGMTMDQLRHVAMNAGGRVEARGDYALIKVEKRGLFGGTDYSHQRYQRNADGTWSAG